MASRRTMGATPGRTARVRCLWAVFLAGAVLPASAQPGTIEECDRAMQERPDRAASYHCYYTVAGRTGEWETALARLRASLHRPHHPRALHVIAAIEQAMGDPHAETTFSAAVSAEEAAGDMDGVVLSLLERAFLLGGQRRLDEAEADLVRARAALPRAQAPFLEASMLVGEGVLAQRRADYGRARGLFRRAETIAFPDSPDFLKSHVLSGLGYTSWALGDYRNAIEYYRREAGLLHRIGNHYGESSPLYNLALTMGYLYGRRQVRRDEADQAIRNALEVAVRSGNVASEGDCRLLLGQGLGGEAGVREFRRALEISRSRRDPVGVLQATRLIAEVYAVERRNGAEAESLAREAVAGARAMGDLEQAAYGEILLAEVAHYFSPLPEAIRRYLEAQDAVERIRDLQPERDVRAGVLSRYVHVYYRPAGYLLDGLSSSPTPEKDIELALQMVERMRTRALLDRMDAAGVSLPAPREAVPLHAQRDQVLSRIADTQRRLMDPSVAGDDRRVALARIERLEQDEAGLRDRIARTDPAFAELRAPDPPPLGRVQAALAPGEALLSYQLWHRPDPAYRSIEDGGSWVVVVTRAAAAAFEIPGRDVLGDKISVFRGLFESRDGSEERAARALYRDLLADALDFLPGDVTRLVIVPDSYLHHLPFAALRDEGSHLPLGLRYQISLSPSIAAWMRWRARDSTPVRAAAALSLADPPSAAGAAAWDGESAWPSGSALGPLPYARREAAALIAGIPGEVETGSAASELRLKRSNLSRLSLIHLAAHAVVDDAHPERSAVLLAPGSPDEDGLLQIREIVDLDLHGPLVVLSTCRSASGKLMEGEGVVDLARAFFLAGARVVVGTRWPIRDDETAALMESFAAAIGRGRSVAAALTEARRARVQAGAPAIAWAGTVVLGDGDFVPAPRAAATAAAPIPLWVAGGLVVLLLLTRRRS